jgi:predicted phage replisome organizer
MADVKWIKITTDIFDDEKILLIENLPSADSIITIWFKLLTLAGKQNNNGVFLMNDRIAYTDEMLATLFRRDINTVRLALNTFEQFGMIEIIDGVITIPNWNKHQTLDTFEKKKLRDRQYQQKRREIQKQLVDDNIKKSSDNRLTSDDKSSCVVVSDRDKEVEVEEDKEKDNNLIISKEIICPSKVEERVVSEWNKLKDIGIPPIARITSGGKRKKYLNTRINQYGIDTVLEAIGRIRKSDFLQGKNNKGWIVTFDWFILPSNFPKVLEGNYDNKEYKLAEQSNKSTEERQETVMDLWSDE